VTEQEQLMKASRKSEEELRQILDLTPQLIAVFGPHYRERLFINRMALEYFGLTLDEWRDTAPGMWEPAFDAGFQAPGKVLFGTLHA
jgi:PAS domain-containing protein